MDAVSAEVDRLPTALDEKSARIEAVRRVQQRGTARGASFEAELGPVLDGCFASHADIFEVTGGTPGIADENVGDFVVTLNSRDTGGRNRRVVFEAKDRPLSMPKALAELDAAMLNRDAQVGVLVWLVDDMHDCGASTGDAWLSRNVPKFQANANTAIFITFDEDSGGGQGTTSPPSNHVAMVVVSPSTSHVSDATQFNHYSLLRTVEDMLGLPCVGSACGASSIVGHFGF